MSRKICCLQESVSWLIIRYCCSVGFGFVVPFLSSVKTSLIVNFGFSLYVSMLLEHCIFELVYLVYLIILFSPSIVVFTPSLSVIWLGSYSKTVPCASTSRPRAIAGLWFSSSNVVNSCQSVTNFSQWSYDLLLDNKYGDSFMLDMIKVYS